MEQQVEHYLQTLVSETRATLGDELIGVYAAGSIALKAFDVDRSDVDVAVVCRSALAEAVKHELVARLRHEALPCPVRGLELVVYNRDVAASTSVAPGFELELNTGAGMDFKVTWHPADILPQDGSFWYGLDRSILHQSGWPLVGPPAPQTFSEPTPADTRELLVAALRWWLAQPTSADASQPAPGSEDAVLGACRALVRHRWKTWLPKVEAGLRVVEDGYEPTDVVRTAIAARSGGPSPSVGRAALFQRQVLRDISGSGP